MSTNRSAELGSETGDTSFLSRKLESLDDIPREISERRLLREFSDHIDTALLATLREVPDVIEDPETFKASAAAAGISQTEGLLGHATRLEDPAHVLRSEMPEQIATEVHEDLHRLTAPELLQEAGADPALRGFYEGATEYLAEQATADLHGHELGRVYPEQVETARQLAAEVGEVRLRDWYFHHEFDQEIRAALERLEPNAP
jgi:hypothetical protein